VAASASSSWRGCSVVRVAWRCSPCLHCSQRRESWRIDQLRSSRRRDHLRSSRRRDHLRSSRRRDHLRSSRKRDHLRSSRKRDHLRSSRKRDHLRSSRMHWNARRESLAVKLAVFHLAAFLAYCQGVAATVHAAVCTSRFDVSKHRVTLYWQCAQYVTS
jgi:hypothetical protein